MPVTLLAQRREEPRKTPTPAAPSAQDIKNGQMLKEEGNALVKKGEHQKAVEKYNHTEVGTYAQGGVA